MLTKDMVLLLPVYGVLELLVSGVLVLLVCGVLVLPVCGVNYVNRDDEANNCCDNADFIVFIFILVIKTQVSLVLISCSSSF